MGGYVEKLRVWWYYEFDDQEVLRLLKVHILEMLADVVQIALVGTLARGCRYRGWIDNQSSMFAIRGQNSRDPKLIELLYVRHAILRREAVRPEASAYVASEGNISDPISRGKFIEFLERVAEEHREREFTRISIQRSPLTNELRTLIHHLCQISLLTTP